ncbi:hypothetical protein JQ506_07745 [Shinella sp. PSBB067]|uniref:hypothetical protein n=1 Tax=Shinella sp. PSBB067 TaxID=2715959 RepID=UPI00193C8610|nr:hypothetical protein [Shinella sp. PSBB067]QRI64873.1 hypothetical protein JQ506_07745 [Shinella sp. PSBB067]
MDLAKTQFLVENHGTHSTIRMFKRKRVSFLFDRDGKPIRPMEWNEWLAFKKTWAKEVERDKLTLRNVWSLIAVGAGGGT